MVQAGLSQQVEEGDYDDLVEVMGNLLAVKERQNTTDTMFEPLQQTIALLKEYEQELPDVVYKQLEVRSDVQSSPIIFKPRLFSLFLPTETEQFFFLFLCFFKSLFHALPPGNPSSVNPALLAFLPLSVSISASVCLSAGAARQVGQCEKAGSVGQAAGGTTAGCRGVRSSSKVCCF